MQTQKNWRQIVSNAEHYHAVGITYFWLGAGVIDEAPWEHVNNAWVGGRSTDRYPPAGITIHAEHTGLEFEWSLFRQERGAFFPTVRTLQLDNTAAIGEALSRIPLLARAPLWQALAKEIAFHRECERAMRAEIAQRSLTRKALGEILEASSPTAEG